MALTFLEAIVDVGKADTVVIAKLKSHSKVGYQDHPLGESMCAGCSMFVEGTPPHCTYVADPISAHGYCREFVAKDANAEVRDRLAQMLGVTFDEGGKVITAKAFSPDEARDAVGRWTSGGGGPDHPDFMEPHEGEAFADAVGEVPSDMHDSIGKIEDAHSNLDAATQEAYDVAGEEDDIMEEHGPESPQYSEWDKRSGKALEEVANKTMELRNAFAGHLDATAHVLNELDKRIQKHANENGVRGK